MTNVEYWGRTYGESTDFRRAIRDATRPGLFGPDWLRSDVPRSWALAEWGQAFVGTDLLPRVAEEALHVMESGTVEEAQLVGGMPWEHAARAVERFLRLLEAPARLGDEPKSVGSAFWRLLRLYGSRPDLVDALRVEAARPNADSLLRSLLAQYGNQRDAPA